MIVLDASVLIAVLDASDAHHGRAVDLLADAAGEDLAVADLTLAEVLVGPARAGRLAEATAAIDGLGVAPVPLPAGAAPALARLRAETSRRLPDCCALLSAEQARAALATFDGALARAARARGQTVLPSSALG